MGWIILAILTAAVFGVLLWFGKLPRGVWELTGAALLLAVTGYAWQGQPGMAGVSIQPVEKANEFDQSSVDSRNNLGEQFGTAQQWLVFSDALSERGKYGSAANYLRNGVREHPREVNLWIGLGNALIAHAKGIITPAAQYAFQQAADLSPEHPGPPVFMGLAYAQSGKFDAARAIWTELLDRSPEDAPWRGDLESRLADIDRIQPPIAQPPENQE